MSEMVTYTVRMKPICFIPDYGLAGVLVGTCKGVMMGIAPGASIIDVTHSIPEFDVIRGAETLRHATRYMPEDAVYLAIVDPGDKTKMLLLRFLSGTTVSTLLDSSGLSSAASILAVGQPRTTLDEPLGEVSRYPGRVIRNAGR
jgi:hypothetical protein